MIPKLPKEGSTHLAASLLRLTEPSASTLALVPAKDYSPLIEGITSSYAAAQQSAMQNRRADFVDTQPLHGEAQFDHLPSRAPRKPTTGLLALALQNLGPIGLGILVVYLLKYLLVG